MRVVLDIETDNLIPSKVNNVWCVVCKEVDNDNALQVFYGEGMRERFLVYASKITEVIGHNIIEFDLSVLSHCYDWNYTGQVTDTLILSRLLNVGRTGGHSLESWGLRLKFPKGNYNDFTKYTPEMLEYCKNDVELNAKIYLELRKVIDRNQPSFDRAIKLEHDIQRVCLDMHDNGFAFDRRTAEAIREELNERIRKLDLEIIQCFPPKTVEVVLKTKTRIETIHFNPNSPKQVIDELWKAGWKPVDRTKGSKKNEDPDKKEKFDKYGWMLNEVNLSTLPSEAPEGLKVLVERRLLQARVNTLTEWIACIGDDGRIHGRFNALGARSHRCTHSNPNMGNIATKKTIKYNTPHLRETAIDLGGRMRSLWICNDDSWLDRIDLEVSCPLTNTLKMQMNITSSGQSTSESSVMLIAELKKIEDSDPSTASLLKNLIEWLQNKRVNVTSVVNQNHLMLITATRPVELGDSYVDTVMQALDGLRINSNQFSITSSNRKKSESFLVGTDMESAHLRIFAHMIDDERFTQSLISGKKEDGTDPHSVNKAVLGSACVDRDRSKTFIFSFLNGAAAPKVSEIFGCSLPIAKAALSKFVRAYPGLKKLKSEVFPRDAERGYFIGIDGRKIVCDSEHLMMGMYLQSTESILMKYANLMWREELEKECIDFRQVNWVHDEWVTEVKGDKRIAERVGELQSLAIRRVGEIFNLRCPMGGEYKVGKNWLEVH